MTPAGNGPSYHVDMSQQTKSRVKQLHLKQAQTGKGHEFLAALRQVIERLRTDPWQFGEPIFSLPALSPAA